VSSEKMRLFPAHEGREINALLLLCCCSISVLEIIFFTFTKLLCALNDNIILRNKEAEEGESLLCGLVTRSIKQRVIAAILYLKCGTANISVLRTELAYEA